MIDARDEAEAYYTASENFDMSAERQIPLTRAQNEVDQAKSLFHKKYPHQPAFFANNIESEQVTAGSTGTKKHVGSTKGLPKLPKDIPRLHTHSARNMDVQIGTKEYLTAEA